MPNYHSLVVNGFFNNPDTNPTGKASIRYNNYGAINGDPAWVKAFPGFVKTITIKGGNPIAVFETPEQGVALWWTLMQKYEANGAYNTVEKIIMHYGGSAQDYSTYAKQVEQWGGSDLGPNTVIDLMNDVQLLKFGKLMARYEAGEPTPLHDDQILYGFNLGRQLAGLTTTAPITPPVKVPGTPVVSGGFFAALVAFLAHLFGPKQKLLVLTRILKRGMMGEDVAALQQRLQQLGFGDINDDGDFGEVTELAVQQFQTARNINPDGEVGDLTLKQLNAPGTGLATKPPLLPPSNAKYGPQPSWYTLAEEDIGFHEVGVNLGIEKFIDTAKAGTRTQLLGQPWCAVGLNSDFERSGVTGSRSAMARSFEHSPNFIKLDKPVLGCVVTFWRDSPSAGTGHCCFYDGERVSDGAIRGIGYNEADRVQRSFHSRARFVGYFWPKAVPLPAKIGPIIVNSDDLTSGKET